MTSIPFHARLRYRFDNTMAKGTVSLIVWLSITSALIVIVAAILFYSFDLLSGSGDAPPGFLESLWFNLMHTFDPGAISGEQGSWGFLLSTFIVSMGGLFIVSALIGLLTTGIDSKLTELRKGRSVVIETDHTIILGWSPHILSIISNLLAANENRRHACIAILADRDKTEMEDELREHFSSNGKTRIVCRSGSPMDPGDLAIVNPDAARSIIILSPETEDPDAHVIKTLLAITNNTGRRAEQYNIVAEIRNERNLEIARMIGTKEVQLVLAGDMIARIAVQTSRQSGLSKVYLELLDFGGNEIYFAREDRVIGKSFGQACLCYRNTSVIGVRSPDGRIELTPPPDRILSRGDQIIAIAEDDDRIVYSGCEKVAIDIDALRTPADRIPQPERMLILGWNRRVPLMLRELDEYLAPGSETVVVADRNDAAGVIERLSGTLRKHRVSFVNASTTDRGTLHELGVPEFDHVIVVAYLDDLDIQEADARTLITLLHLREIAEHNGRSFSIVSEMLDMRNRELAEITHADDFIVDIKLVSMMLSQISENRELSAVFADLFDAEGTEIYLKPVEDYVATGRPVDFYTVTASATSRGESAIGYRCKANASNSEKGYGVVLNPDKEAKVAFEPGDTVIVVARE